MEGETQNSLKPLLLLPALPPGQWSLSASCPSHSRFLILVHSYSSLLLEIILSAECAAKKKISYIPYLQIQESPRKRNSGGTEIFNEI